MKFILFFCSILVSLQLAAQGDTILSKRKVNITVHKSDGIITKGILIGKAGNSLLIKRKDVTESISYEQITSIKTKKVGVAGGAARGAIIGLAPALFGQGGAYVAIVAFPTGIVVGSILGAVTSRNHIIGGNQQAFLRFTNKYVR